MCHLVVGASQLEAEYRLQVLALEQDVAFQAVAQVRGVCEWGFLNHLVDTGGEDKAQILPIASTSVALYTQFLVDCVLTSGYPFGSRNASGMALWAFDFGLSDGGLGFAVYSVSDRLVWLGVRGVAEAIELSSGVVGRE